MHFFPHRPQDAYHFHLDTSSREGLPLLDMRHIRLQFGQKHVLEDFSLKVSQKEIVAIIGPSGSGKSTILKVVAGLLAPDSGTMTLRSEKIGMAFQFSALLTSLNVFDNVALPLRKQSRLSESDIQQRVQNTLTMVGLKENLDTMPNELSGGMQKRVGIARALAIEPDIILYDEPSSGLDPMTAAKLEADIRRICKQVGAATLLVTHSMETVENIVDRVLILHKGHIAWQGNRKEFLSTDNPYPLQFRTRSTEGPISI
jgi:phospholipid/cholesterol/gamma-HCH transport system ATP-binding protein